MMKRSAATTNAASGRERRSTQLRAAAPRIRSGEGMARSSAVSPSTPPRTRAETPSNSTRKWVFTYPITAARVGVNPGLAVVRSEDRVSAGEVAQIEAHVHQVRVPGQKHDGRVGAEGAFDLRQHSLLARLDQFESAEAEQVLPQHAEHQA